MFIENGIVNLALRSLDKTEGELESYLDHLTTINYREAVFSVICMIQEARKVLEKGQ